MKKIISALTTAAMLLSLTACGADNSNATENISDEATETTNEFRKIGFYKNKITISVKSEWQYNVTDNSLMVKAANDKSSVYITAEDLEYDLGEMDFANIYNKMKQGANNVMRVTKLTPLENSEIYAFSYYDLELSASVHVFMFDSDGTLFTMYFGEDSSTKKGDVVKNIDTVLDPIIKARSNNKV